MSRYDYIARILKFTNQDIRKHSKVVLQKDSDLAEMYYFNLFIYFNN